MTELEEQKCYQSHVSGLLGPGPERWAGQKVESLVVREAALLVGSHCGQSAPTSLS